MKIPKTHTHKIWKSRLCGLDVWNGRENFSQQFGRQVSARHNNRLPAVCYKRPDTSVIKLG